MKLRLESVVFEVWPVCRWLRRVLKEMKKIAYLRVSTQDQKPDRQIEGLRGHADELHIEYASAATLARPVYNAVLDRLEAGDMLVVWDLDRAYRSVVDAITEVEKLRGRGIRLRIVNLDIDLDTPAGMLIYTMMGALAEFERRTLSRRTKEGLAAARARGARLGRPRKLSACQLRDARHALAEGRATMSALAADYGVAPWTLRRALDRDPFG